MHNVRSRRPRAVVVGIGAGALILSACGPQVSDAAIKAAAAGGGSNDGQVVVQVAGNGAPAAAPAVGGTASRPTTGATLAPAGGAGGSALPVGGAPVAAGAQTPGAVSSRSGVPQAAGAGGTSSAPPNAQGAPVVANKSPVTLGVVGTFSGPVGGFVKDTATGVRLWAQWANAHGGVNGHPVNVAVGDDQGDPARYNSLLQQFVEQNHAIAFAYTTLGFAPNGNNTYLDSKKIYTFGTEGGLANAYSDPYVVTPTPTGPRFAEAMIWATAKVATPKGKTKLAEFACSDFSLCDLFDKKWSDPATLQATGFTLVKRGRPSLTQPDFTSECLSAKQAGADTVLLALDTASFSRFASACARQNYHPILASADLLANSALPQDPNLDGFVIGTKNATWVDKRVPGVANLYAAAAQFAPGMQVDGALLAGWIFGTFFGAAAAHLPDNPTPADVANGLYQIKNNTLDGMTYPLTFTKGQTSPNKMCYGVVVVANRQYVQGPGASLNCP